MQLEVKFFKPFIPEIFQAYSKDIVKSGILTKGKYVNIFEEKLKETTGAKYCICVSSGTAALHIAANIIDETTAYISAYGFPAAFNAFLLADKRVVSIDCNLTDYNMDISELYQNIGYEDGAIVVIHQFGYPARLPVGIGTVLIEDAACALFTEENGKHLGTVGDIGILSFHPRKIITTGEGGALLFNNEELYLKAKAFYNHGISSPGLNYRMPELSAAMGISQLDIKKYIVSQRISIYERYMATLKSIPNVILPEYTLQFCPQSFVVRISGVDTEEKRNSFIQKMTNSGVGCMFASKSVVNLPYVFSEEMKRTKILTTECVSLPFYTELPNEAIDYVCEVLKEVCNDI
jgi:dTDP-4-amino-4,6-dideoxygalactose transaminase